MDPQSPFIDHAAPILKGEPSITDDQRADLWDVFHNSKSAEDLQQKLQPLAVPDDLKQSLWDKKKKTMPLVSPVTTAISQLAQLDPPNRELAEGHPNLLKALIAANTPEPEPAAGASAAGKGKPAGKAQKAAPLVQGPRPDGLEHMPPIPDGHHRVKTSDGGIWDVPAEGLDAAREKDPNLHVLNP
jgi:hypothetical protein